MMGVQQGTDRRSSRADSRRPGREEVAQGFQRALSTDPFRWSEAWRVRESCHPPTIRFYRPTKTLPVSLTGGACALNCAHCGGHYLQHMRPIWSETLLSHAGKGARGNGATSYLISGGCDRRGRVPVTSHLDRVAELRRGRRLNWHVGLIDEEAMQAIAPLVDVISFDLVGDAKTAREVYGLDLTLSDYIETFEMLRRYVPVVPHITLGLRGGRLSGERAALEALQRQRLDALVLIILIPTDGTKYARCAPPTLPEVAELLVETRLLLPETRLCLGCMRPLGAYRQAVDELALEAGFNGIVNPSGGVVRRAAAMGLQSIWRDECCALD